MNKELKLRKLISEEIKNQLNENKNNLINKYKKMADKISQKVQNRINTRGAYENAGQPEIRKFMDMVNRDYANLTYSERADLHDYIINLIDNLKY